MLGSDLTNSRTLPVQLGQLQRVQSRDDFRAAHDLISVLFRDQARAQDRFHVAGVLGVGFLVVPHEVHLIVGEAEDILELRRPACGALGLSPR